MLETRPCANLLRHDLLAAPGSENDVGRGGDHGVRRDNSIFGRFLFAQMRKDVLAAGNLDQLRNPTDAADERIVPFLEINARTRACGRCRNCLVNSLCQQIGERGALLRGADERAERADHRQDAGNVALVEHVNRDADPGQFRGDFRLEVGEAEDEIGFETQDFGNVGRDERGHARFFPPHLRRPNRIARDADDAALFTEQIESLYGLFGEADDTLRGKVAHLSLVCAMLRHARSAGSPA